MVDNGAHVQKWWIMVRAYKSDYGIQELAETQEVISAHLALKLSQVWNPEALLPERSSPVRPKVLER